MGFIPKRIKKLFSRKARKGDAVAEPQEEAAAPAEAAPEPEAPPAPPKPDPLAFYKQPEGYYAIDIAIRPSMGKGPAGQQLQWISGRDINFELVVVGPSPLAGCKTIATELENHLIKKYDIDIGQTYFQVQTPPPALMDFYVEGYEKTIGLRPGVTVKALLVPEGCTWTPPADRIAPLQDSFPGTSTILAEPWTLLKQVVPRYNWQTMYVNGMDVMTPQPPQMPGAGPAAEVDFDAPVAEEAARVAVEKTMEAPEPTVTPAPGKPDVQATPAAAPKAAPKPPGGM